MLDHFFDRRNAVGINAGLVANAAGGPDPAKCFFGGGNEATDAEVIETACLLKTRELRETS